MTNSVKLSPLFSPILVKLFRNVENEIEKEVVMKFGWIPRPTRYGNGMVN